MMKKVNVEFIRKINQKYRQLDRYNKGNVLDLEHFSDTFNQVKSRLKKGSLIVFDKGANTKDNLNLILDAEMDYLTSMKLNSSDDKIIENFDLERAELIDSKKGIYGIKIIKPSSIKYFYFSESLQKKQLEPQFPYFKRILSIITDIYSQLIPILKFNQINYVLDGRAHV